MKISCPHLEICGSRKYPYPPQRGLLEIQGGGVRKQTFFERKYEPKLEIPDSSQKTLLGRDVNIF